MTIAHQFDYVRPESIADTVAILNRHRDRARILAGGTDLVPWMRDDAVHPEVVVDVKRVPGLRDIERPLNRRGITRGRLARARGCLRIRGRTHGIRRRDQLDGSCGD